MIEQSGFSIEEEIKRPLVSFVLFAYNHETYICEAMKAALAQTYSPLEIIISDDCSADNTFSIVREMARCYCGPHDLIIRQNSSNIGFAAHINVLMTLVRGDLIVVAAGDDISFPERVNVVVQCWLSGGRESGSIFSRFQVVNESGKVTRDDVPSYQKRVTLADRDFGKTRSMTVGTSGCAHAWTRDLFEFFGPINERILHEDITIPLRSLMIGSVTFLPDILVSYRMIAGSLSRASFANHNERFRKMARYWEGRVCNYEQFLLDTQKVLARWPDFSGDIDWISNIISNEADAAQVNHQFFGGTYLQRICLVLNFSMNIPAVRRLKLFALALVPGLYNVQSSRRLLILFERYKNKLFHPVHFQPRKSTHQRT
jgi:glycosyltransferase involved in cell wall biosynthesis